MFSSIGMLCVIKRSMWHLTFDIDQGSHHVSERPLKECPGTMLCMMTCKGHYTLGDVGSNGCRSCTCPTHHETTHTSTHGRILFAPNSENLKTHGKFILKYFRVTKGQHSSRIHFWWPLNFFYRYFEYKHSKFPTINSKCTRYQALAYPLPVWTR